jgi:short-subunit dehydrogenase
MANETALITGASSGIGLELARLFAGDKSDLVLVARRADRLEALATELAERHGVKVMVMPKDLADDKAPQQIYDRLAGEGIDVDVVVNNAGFGARGAVVEIDPGRQLDMLRVNVTAPTHLCRLFLPQMLERRRGGILNVASTAAFQPGPFMGVYYASKAYLLSFSEALVEETRGTGVTVSCLAPGATRSEFQAVANLQDALVFKLGTQSSEAVARAGYDGFRRGKAIVVPGLKNKIGAASVRFTPRPVIRRILRRLQS